MNDFLETDWKKRMTIKASRAKCSVSIQTLSNELVTYKYWKHSFFA